MSNRPKILVLCDYYLPGYKSGGGMRTIVNIVDRLGDQYDFRIITRDHDGKLDRETYSGVEINAWNQVKGAPVYYLSKDNIRISTLRSLIKEVEPDVVYANSFFSTLAIYLLKLRKLGLIRDYPVIIAPCGELAAGALTVKSSKKKVFLNYSRFIKLYKNVVWKASGQGEAVEIERVAPKHSKIIVAPDLPPSTIYPFYDQREKPVKQAGHAKFAFLSRYVKAKNFNWLFGIFKDISFKLEVDIIGPLEDRDYWSEAEKMISALPENVTVRSVGPIPHPEVSEALSNYHFFTSATLGENFGHIFLEALASGCPMIISDRTPWRDLESLGVGWDISLDDSSGWLEAFEACGRMGNEEYVEFSSRARSYAMKWLEQPELDRDTIDLLDFALSQRG